MKKILFAALAGSAIMLAGCGQKTEEAPAVDAAAASDAAAVATDAAATATDAAATATDAASAEPDDGATDAGTSGGSVRP
jgi:PBP1b-binding outer membrane lipoprotein LpoB